MPKIQLRHDTAANWTTANPTLLAGEAGVETDTGKFKLGNGTDNWTTLAYAQGDIKDYVAGTGINFTNVYNTTLLKSLPWNSMSGGSGETAHSITLARRTGSQPYEIIEREAILFYPKYDTFTLNIKSYTSTSNATTETFSNKKVVVEIFAEHNNNRNYFNNQPTVKYYTDANNTLSGVINNTSSLVPSGEIGTSTIEFDLTGKTAYGFSLTIPCTSSYDFMAIHQINIRDGSKVNNTINVSPSTSSTIGGVKPDGTTTTVDSNGTITAVTDPGGTMQTQINGLQTGLTGLQTEVTTLSGNVSSITTEFSALDSRVNATESSIETINTNLGGLKFVALTQAEYNALTTKDTNTVYIIKEAAT